jgi:hypothetical protein
MTRRSRPRPRNKQRPLYWTPPSIFRLPEVLTEVEVIEAEAEVEGARSRPRGSRFRGICHEPSLLPQNQRLTSPVQLV